MPKSSPRSLDILGDFLDTEKLEDLVADAANKATLELLRSKETKLAFPVVWYPTDGYQKDKKAPSDPTTVHLTIPSEPYGDDMVVRSFSLRESIREWMLDAAVNEGELMEFSEGLRMLSASLRKLADNIDATLEKAEREQRQPSSKA